MKLKLKNTPEQVELIKAIGSRDQLKSREAAEAFAAFLGPVVGEVLLHAGTAGAIFTDSEYDEDDSPSYPLDLYYGESANHVQVWSQSMAGGLPSSHVSGMQELKISTYRLDSAVSFNKRYARKARLDIISKAIERMAQEVLVKQERNAWAVLLKALAEASTTPVGGSATKHIVASNAAGTFALGDLNALLTRIKRINESFVGGTPVAPYSKGMTDLYVSPEMKEQIRAFAYNAVGNSSVDLPANVREGIFRQAGMQEIYGVNIVELIELGIDKRYNILFDSFTSGQSVPGHNSSAWNGSDNDELLIGIDNSRGAMIRPVARNADSGSTFTALPDDQFNITRVDKAGFYGSMEEGRLCLDSRALVGIVV